MAPAQTTPTANCHMTAIFDIAICRNIKIAVSGPGYTAMKQTQNCKTQPLIRVEERKDWDAVRDLNAAAFETPAEAQLIDNLRRGAGPVISLVAARKAKSGVTQIDGHIMFSAVFLSGHADLAVMGLAPMAVAPEHQGRGIGSALVRTGLERCARLGVDAVFVLGHPEYYPRFGFVPASRFKISCQYEVPDNVFMAIECKTGRLAGRSGAIRYGPAFPAS